MTDKCVLFEKLCPGLMVKPQKFPNTACNWGKAKLRRIYRLLEAKFENYFALADRKRYYR